MDTPAESKPQPIASPDQVVAASVVDALLVAGLIREKSKASFISKLSTGKLTEEDWKLETQLAVTPKKEPAK